MSGDCSSTEMMTPQVLPSMPNAALVSMLLIVSRAMRAMSMCAFVLISPATTHKPVVTRVSHATRPYGSSARTASRTLSLIASAILSGWPSVTDSDVNVCLLNELPLFA
jgi:hypothetical protein